MSTEELHKEASYKLLLEVRYDDLLPFIQQYVFIRTFSMYAFWLFNSLVLFWLVLEAITDLSAGIIGWVDLFINLGLALLLVFTVLIIVHEAIHGLAYKLTGAPKVSYGANWRSFYFYVVADKFVLRRKAFIFVALAPFILVSAGIIIALLFVAPPLKWVLYGILFFHSGACAGDFGIMSFYEKNRQYKEMLTYDEVGTKTSYFFVK